MQNSHSHRPTIIISGPTASGKTALSLAIAQQKASHIINADVGQLYTPLSIGTAKPNWQSQPVPHYCFDVAGTPSNISAPYWRSLVHDAQARAHDAGKVPIIVGGTLFYLKSLYFPINQESAPRDGHQWQDIPDVATPDLWRKLAAIDPDRAGSIHPNDRYRIVRALAIWEQTGELPSRIQPLFKPEFESIFVFLCPPAEQLRHAINVRTHEMFAQGWVDEVRALMGTPWEDFLCKKKLIGYPLIIEWLRRGALRSEEKALIDAIVTSTWQYARRQIIFWRSLEACLTKNKNNSPFGCTVVSLSSIDNQSVERVLWLVSNQRKG